MQRNTSQNATLKQKAEKQSFKDKHQNIEGSFLALPQGWTINGLVTVSA